MRVKEQQIIERRTNSDGSVAETLSVRRPSMGDPEPIGRSAEDVGDGVQGQMRSGEAR